MTREDDEEPAAFSIGSQADTRTIHNLAPFEHSLLPRGGRSCFTWVVLHRIDPTVVKKGIFGLVPLDHPHEDIRQDKDFCSLELSPREM